MNHLCVLYDNKKNNLNKWENKSDSSVKLQRRQKRTLTRWFEKTYHTRTCLNSIRNTQNKLSILEAVINMCVSCMYVRVCMCRISVAKPEILQFFCGLAVFNLKIFIQKYPHWMNMCVGFYTFLFSDLPILCVFTPIKYKCVTIISTFWLMSILNYTIFICICLYFSYETIIIRPVTGRLVTFYV